VERGDGKLITSTTDKTGPKQYADKKGVGCMSMFCHYMSTY